MAVSERCSCSGWKENMPKFDAVFVVAALHRMKYDGEVFRFCPYCGKPLKADVEESARASRTLGRDWSCTRGELAATRRACVKCGDMVTFESERNGCWKRTCLACGYTEKGFAFDEQKCPCCGGTSRATDMDRSQATTTCPECGYWVSEYADVEEAAPESKEACCGAGDASCCA